MKRIIAKAALTIVAAGGVGVVSGHATTDGPGAVGEFSSSMAQNHGSVLDCLP
jgi:hypothetical protein